ncbi:MAG: YgfZ/GcvT domain-containing protein [Thermoleophilaceae bacterium]
MPTARPTAVPASDHDLLRREVGLVDRSERGKLRLTGAEAAEFLQGQVSNDVEALTAGEGCYATLLDPKGRIRADLRVLRGSDWLRLDTEAAGLSALAQTVRMYSIGRDVRSEDETEALAILSLVGPAAREVLDASPAEREHAWVEGEHGLYVATDLGVDVLCPAPAAAAVRTALGVREVGAEAAECVRIESGRPRLGHELDGSTIPQEAGLNDRAVSFTKGCYVGQETVARLHYKGRPNRHLRGLRLSGPAHPGESIRLEERELGRLGSICVSPEHGPIALALVRREAEPGDRVTVGESELPAEVVALPFA